MDKLKKCPFSKNDITIVSRKQINFKLRYKILCECGISTKWFDTEQQAIDSWNTRPETGLKKFVKEYEKYYNMNKIIIEEYDEESTSYDDRERLSASKQENSIIDKAKELLAEENL